MPDLKSELMKLDNLKFDDDAGETEVVEHNAQTTNVSKQIWEYVRDNPGVSSTQVWTNMNLPGDAVSTRMTQMFKRGWLRRKLDANNNFLYSTPFTEYPARPMKESLQKAHEARMANSAARKKAAKKEAKASATRKPDVRLNEPASFDLNQLSVLQARALYEQLKNLFGG